MVSGENSEKLSGIDSSFNLFKSDGGEMNEKKGKKKLKKKQKQEKRILSGLSTG